MNHSLGCSMVPLLQVDGKRDVLTKHKKGKKSVNQYNQRAQIFGLRAFLTSQYDSSGHSEHPIPPSLRVTVWFACCVALVSKFSTDSRSLLCCSFANGSLQRSAANRYYQQQGCSSFSGKAQWLCARVLARMLEKRLRPRDGCSQEQWALSSFCFTRASRES